MTETNQEKYDRLESNFRKTIALRDQNETQEARDKTLERTMSIFQNLKDDNDQE